MFVLLIKKSIRGKRNHNNKTVYIYILLSIFEFSNIVKMLEFKKIPNAFMQIACGRLKNAPLLGKIFKFNDGIYDKGEL